MGSFKVLLFGPAREAATPLWRQMKAWKGGGIQETGAVSSPTVTTGNSCVLWQQHCNLHWPFGAGDGQWRTHGGGLFGFGTVALKHQEKRLPHVFLKFGWDETLHHTIFWWELEEHPSCSYFASWFNPKKIGLWPLWPATTNSRCLQLMGAPKCATCGRSVTTWATREFVAWLDDAACSAHK